LRPPANWTVKSRKLVFMVENQGCCLYGTPAGSQPSGDDPSVFMAENDFMGETDDPIPWSRIKGRCSDFLLVMLHHQAAYFGAMPYGATAQARAGLRKVLDRDWSFVGELFQMRAYRKAGRVVCLETVDGGQVSVGVNDEAELAAVARDLGLQFTHGGSHGGIPGLPWDAPAFNANGVKISYSLQGEGEAVVLIHGLLSRSRIDWDDPGTAALLAKDHQVVALDLPGHGLSDKPVKEEAYGLELVEDVIRLMDHLEINKAHVVGYCLGSIVAAKLLARHPDRVLSGTFGGMGWLRQGGFAQKVYKHFRQIAGNAVRACARSLGKLALTKKELESIRVPVMVLVGERDAEIKKLYVEPLQAVRKDWRVVKIKNANHLNCHEKPQYKRQIAKWLAKQTRR